jgi:hypothetical protein
MSKVFLDTNILVYASPFRYFDQKIINLDNPSSCVIWYPLLCHFCSGCI